MKFEHKRIADPVHGTISLSEAEIEVLSTPVFQRLRNVKQLGLAYLIYPGADYSRFSHSVGACHVAGQVLSHLEKSDQLLFWTKKDRDTEIQHYRIAALLHDIGHYPYSHTMENALSNYYDEALTTEKVDSSKGNEKSEAEESSTESALDHEDVGAVILAEDKPLKEALDKFKLDPKKILAIFRKEEQNRLKNLISADLDVDRLDYLGRTAQHTSLPYGTVDIRYLISQTKVDADNRLAITSKALRTAEHLLLSRYFDYLQISFHKTVAGLELLLEDVIIELLKTGKIKCSPSDVRKSIQKGEWPYFDDTYISSEIRKLARSKGSSNGQKKARAIINRKPPLLAAASEHVRDRVTYADTFENHIQAIKGKISGWASHFGIDPDMWRVWSREVKFTKVGMNTKDEDEFKLEEVVRILQPNSNVSIPIIEDSSSIFNTLANNELFALRVYVQLDEDSNPELRKDIRKQIEADLSDIDWNKQYW